MKRTLIFLFIVFCLFSLTYAFSIENYEIILEQVDYHNTIEFVKLNLMNLSENEITYSVFGRIEDPYVICKDRRLDFDYFYINSTSNIKIQLDNCTELSIRFRDNDLITKNKEYLFFNTIRFPFKTQKFNLCFKLPEGAKISEQGFFPRDGETKTDGKRIIICWTRYNLENEEIPFSVYFEPIFNFNFVFISILLLSIFFILISFHFYRQRKIYFLKGFSEDEKKVLQILMKQKKEYQNKIRKELKISRAKMTRIVSDLVKKNVIIKERKGRKNKLIFKELH